MHTPSTLFVILINRLWTGPQHVHHLSSLGHTRHLLLLHVCNLLAIGHTSVLVLLLHVVSPPKHPFLDQFVLNFPLTLKWTLYFYFEIFNINIQIFEFVNKRLNWSQSVFNGRLFSLQSRNGGLNWQREAMMTRKHQLKQKTQKGQHCHLNQQALGLQKMVEEVLLQLRLLVAEVLLWKASQRSLHPPTLNQKEISKDVLAIKCIMISALTS